MISKESRYKNTNTYFRDNTEVFESRKYIEFEDYYRYIMLEGDTLTNIAYKCYGDSTQWWRIMDANPQYNTPLDIHPGDVINIPFIKEV